MPTYCAKEFATFLSWMCGLDGIVQKVLSVEWFKRCLMHCNHAYCQCDDEIIMTWQWVSKFRLTSACDHLKLLPFLYHARIELLTHVMLITHK